jgi:hypothetical protein
MLADEKGWAVTIPLRMMDKGGGTRLDTRHLHLRRGQYDTHERLKKAKSMLFVQTLQAPVLTLQITKLICIYPF